LVEARSDRGHAPSNGSLRARVEQAYLRASNTAGSIGLQVGRFASPFGSYGLRHLSTADPFLRPPLAYDYRTVMNRSHAPGSATGFLTWKDWPELFRYTGVPPVWDVPYQWGAMGFGRAGPLDVRVAAMNSAPSSKPDAWGLSGDRLEHPSWVAAVRWKASAALEVGASYDRGPWLDAITAGTIQGTSGGGTPSRWDFDQELVAADLSFARGSTVLRGEVIVDSWEVPNVGAPFREVAYHAEVQRDLRAGLSGAARLGAIDFRAWKGSGSNEDWDRDVVRLEGALGYRIVRNGGATLSGYWQRASGGANTVLVGLRTWWAF
jgi:hypothetical protein